MSLSSYLGSLLALLAMVSLAACGSGQPAGESPTAEERDLVHYFGQKPFTIVVNYKVGGSTDAWVRMFARHLGRYLPSQPGLTTHRCRHKITGFGLSSLTRY